MVHIKKKNFFKNSRYYSYPHYTDVEIEHREVKGLSQSLRLSRCWSHDSNQTVLPLVFTTTLQATPFASCTPDICCFLVFQSLKESCQPVSLDMLSLPTEFLTVGTFSSFPSESKCHGVRRSSLYLLKS